MTMHHSAQAILMLCGLAACLGVSAQLQPLNINTTGQDWGVLSKHHASAPVPSQTPNPCLSVDPQCVECSNNECSACNIIFVLDMGTKTCICPSNQKLSQDGTTCINMGVVDVGKALYNNTDVQDGLYKAAMKVGSNNKVVDSFVAATAKTAANFLQGGQDKVKCGKSKRCGQDKVKYGASKALASALAPIVQPAEFIPAPKQPQPDSAPAPEAAPDAAVAGQPQPAAPALAPKDAEYYQLVAEGKAQQAQERQDAQSKVLQASGLAPAQALAPTVASVADAVQGATARAQAQQQSGQSAQQQPAQGQAAGTTSGLNPISALVSQAGGLLANYLPVLGRRLLRE